jgi:hypothetical protein
MFFISKQPLVGLAMLALVLHTIVQQANTAATSTSTSTSTKTTTTSTSTSTPTTTTFPYKKLIVLAEEKYPSTYNCSVLAELNQGVLSTVIQSITNLINGSASLTAAANAYVIQAQNNLYSAVWRNQNYQLQQLISDFSVALLNYVNSTNVAYLALNVQQFYLVALKGSNASLQANIPYNVQTLQVSTVIACLNSSNLFAYVDTSNYGLPLSLRGFYAQYAGDFTISTDFANSSSTDISAP